MGGDFAPQNVVSGCVQAVSEFELQVMLVGIASRLQAELAKHSVPPGPIEVVDAPEVIGMDEPATTAMRRKRNSSLRVAVDAASKGEAQAVVSAGNTGAVYATV